MINIYTTKVTGYPFLRKAGDRHPQTFSGLYASGQEAMPHANG